MNNKPKRRRFQFTLKTLLGALTLLCIGPGGYVANEQSKARNQKAVVEAIERFGGKVAYDAELPCRSPMMRQILGDDTYGNLYAISLVGTQETDTALVHLAGLKDLTRLLLADSQVSDSGLVHLAGLKSLQYLALDNTNVTDAGLNDIGGLTNLEALSLDNTHVTDVGLKKLSTLTALEVLSLKCTRITDAGLMQLRLLPELKVLHLHGTSVTNDGVVNLQNALPKCTIRRYSF